MTRSMDLARLASFRHLREQGASIVALAKVAVPRRSPGSPETSTPGPWVMTTVAPPSAALVAAYLREVGGDPARYPNRIPAHLFPQWTFAPALKLVSGLPYPVIRGANPGARLVQHAPLPLGEPLQVSARIERVEASETRALVAITLITETRSSPRAVEAEMRFHFPLAKKRTGAPRSIPTVPGDARRLATLDLGPRAGLEFAKLTGDVNPIHWLPPYARSAGYPNCILHGYATIARTIEVLNAQVFSGAPDALASFEAKLTRPLVLPAQVGVFVGGPAGTQVWVAPDAGEPPFLEGTFTTEAKP